eukprot:UN03760
MNLINQIEKCLKDFEKFRDFHQEYEMHQQLHRQESIQSSNRRVHHVDVRNCHEISDMIDLLDLQEWSKCPLQNRELKVPPRVPNDAQNLKKNSRFVLNRMDIFVILLQTRRFLYRYFELHLQHIYERLFAFIEKIFHSLLLFYAVMS